MLNVLTGDTVAQEAHVGWGALFVLALMVWGLPFWAAFAVMAAFALVKEVLEATGHAFWEPKQTWPSSLVDFVFWLVGGPLGWGIFVLGKRI